MQDLLVAIGLAIALEGCAYALFPEAMKKMMAVMLGQPAERIRVMGVMAAALGVVIVWLVMG